MKRLIAAALITTLPASFALASSDAKLTPESKAEITQKMTDLGYEVRKIDVEDGMIEVYAMKDGERYELYLDAAYNVVTTKRDD